MSLKLHFISLENDFIEHIKKKFEIFEKDFNIVYDVSSIENIPKDKTAFISPANCLGYMDGGIDLIFSRKMFPNIESFVKEKIKSLDTIIEKKNKYCEQLTQLMNQQDSKIKKQMTELEKRDKLIKHLKTKNENKNVLVILKNQKKVI